MSAPAEPAVDGLPTPTAAQFAAPERDRSRPRRLVIVDDDTVARLVLARLLRRLGHQVLDAPDVTRGLALVRAERPDVVLSDYNLPDGTGDDLLAGIRAAGMETPFVLISGLAELQQVRYSAELLRSGHRPTATMTKPVDTRSVATCLAEVFQGVDAADREGADRS